MITPAKLKMAKIFKALDEKMLGELVTIFEERRMKAGELLFTTRNKADNFFLVKTGKVILERNISPGILVTLSTMKHGCSFGWAVLLDDMNYSMTATCKDSGELYFCNKKKLLSAMEHNSRMGFLIMKQAAIDLKSRFSLCTEELLKALMSNPDISELDETSL